MRVFVTGASGFIGTALVRELISAGHSVVGLARTASAAAALKAMGAIPRTGTLSDLDGLRKAASEADGVAHLAYMHGLGQIPLRQRLRIFLGGSPAGIVSRFVRTTAEADRRAIDAIGAGLQGSDRPLVTTFGTMGLTSPGRIWASPSTEADTPDTQSPGAGRAAIEQTALAWVGHRVRTSIVRLPPTVHGPDNAGFVSELIRIARARKVSAYPDDGSNRWPAVHREDAARLFRLALERGTAGACYHGVAEQGIPMRDIAEAIAGRLELPCTSQAPDRTARHFGWLAPFVGLDNPSCSEQTRNSLGWIPNRPGLIEDLRTEKLFH